MSAGAGEGGLKGAPDAAEVGRCDGVDKNRSDEADVGSSVGAGGVGSTMGFGVMLGAGEGTLDS